MHFGADYFRIIEFVIAVLRLLAKIFGDDDDRKADKDTKDKYGDYAEKIVE